MQTKPVVDPALAHDYLTRALMLLEQPQRDLSGTIIKENSWITGREAIQSNGQSCSPEDERAVAWCTIGVIRAVTKYDPNPNAAYNYICSLLDASPVALAHGSLPASNDSASTFDRVRKTFQRAIRLTERFLNVD